jgi:hypothetical protein
MAPHEKGRSVLSETFWEGKGIGVSRWGEGIRVRNSRALQQADSRVFARNDRVTR